jgi:hypothetical protein
LREVADGFVQRDAAINRLHERVAAQEKPSSLAKSFEATPDADVGRLDRIDAVIDKLQLAVREFLPGIASVHDALPLPNFN